MWRDDLLTKPKSLYKCNCGCTNSNFVAWLLLLAVLILDYCKTRYCNNKLHSLTYFRNLSCRNQNKPIVFFFQTNVITMGVQVPRLRKRKHALVFSNERKPLQCDAPYLAPLTSFVTSYQSGWTDFIAGHASLQSFSDNLLRIFCTKHTILSRHRS